MMRSSLPFEKQVEDGDTGLTRHSGGDGQAAPLSFNIIKLRY